MKFRVGACALLVCLAACSSEGTNSKFGDLVGSASPNAARGNQVSPVNAPRSPADSIANAPDLGALVSYPNKGVASKQEGAYTWYPIAISEEHALRAVATGEMVVPSPDGSQVKLRYERHVEHADGNWTWIGRVVDGDQRQEAILTFGERAVYGSIPQANGAPALNLQTMAGKLWAVVTDPSKVVSPNKGKNDVMVAPALALRASLAPAIVQAQETQASAIAAGAPASSTNTIDLAIGYTQGFATAQGGQSAAVTRLNFLVEVGNQAFVNSLIDGYLRIVSTVQVTYADNTDNELALSQLTGHNGSSTIAVPAALVPIRTARDQYGADLAVLVRDFQTPENNGCGIAWLNGADQYPISPTADDDFGFAVISDGTDGDTDGKTYFCSPETLVHELGHLMGSAHDRDNSTDGDGNLQYGRYAYSFGMKTDNTSGNFYTIMAYGDDNQNFYRTFSNPLVARCGPTGNLICGVTNQTDNARSLNQTIPVVAQFRASVIPFAGSAEKDFDGDGASDILWRNTSGNNIIWKSANSLTPQYVYSLSTAWKVVGVADFSGDGRADILWRNGGANVVWTSGLATSPQAISSVPSYWSVAGTGDFNGDGRADILWRNGSLNTIWRSGNASTQQAVSSLATPWAVAGVGDFDGDGTADILWRHPSTGGNIIWKSANASTPQYVSSVSTIWSVAGVADFDGDGRSDILWRSTSGGNAIWRSGNSGTQQAVNSVATYWQVAGMGDFDGDGRSDIHWRTGTLNVIWRAANASNQQTVAVQPTVWIAQPAP